MVAELAERNIQISPRGASSLGRKFIVYLAIAHDRCSDDITEAMRLKGGYICHLDATCEGRDPILMSSLDSISQIVLGNIKLSAFGGNPQAGLGAKQLDSATSAE